MGSITNSLNGLSYLTQSGGIGRSGPRAGLSSSITQTELQPASPKDVVSLSKPAVRTPEADGLYGRSQDSRNRLAADLFPGLSAGDPANAGPREQAAISNQGMQLQQIQRLFGEPTSVAGTTRVIG